ncbi:DUF4276 family protein [Streptosporangium sp. NBC_01755]|uniref:DUF4276 family protein n=1 Tax=unclassified Streptosporangium TaxID=2632669 RepID=UPI002DD7C9E9|nr:MULTISPECIES: DUF4276 family protein [unclassified Streptosporangium]WSA29200.1 DUF4276 family protein [Streptosporangium sp. NBC_01810]WSC99355.1 DUF4276 family protein [Streptosporangium sp. NBC_01755]
MTGAISIATVVEGEGEVAALPILLRRIAHDLSVWNIRIPAPLRVPRSKLVAPGGVEKAVLQASYRVDGLGGILLLIDADDDCPATTGPALLERARQARGDREISMVLANREFEAWFLAAASSLAGHRGLADPLEAPTDPEGPRDAKGWLSTRKIDGTSYRPTVDQAALTTQFDMAQARKNAPSFDKFWRDVERLIRGASR